MSKRCCPIAQQNDLRALGDKQGLALAVALMLLAVLTVLGTAAYVETTTDIRIAVNYRAAEQAFYAANGGIEEARGRLCPTAKAPVVDLYPTLADWRGYIADAPQAEKHGYDVRNMVHIRYDPIAGELPAVVAISHKTDENSTILYWGDADGDGRAERNTAWGARIYAVSSFGYAGARTSKRIDAELASVPAPMAPAALYTEGPSLVQGPQNHIVGTDQCTGADKPGLATPQDDGSIVIDGGPQIEPNIVYNSVNLDVDAIVSYYKILANHSYSVGGTVQLPTTRPGPGDGWDRPVPGGTFLSPSSCATGRIVHYDTGGTYVGFGGVCGCGLLIVEGDLNIDGAFSWYGPVIVTGSVLFTGGGDKHITGSLIAGGSVVMGVHDGNTAIVYCSAALHDQTSNLPLCVLSWKEDI